MAAALAKREAVLWLLCQPGEYKRVFSSSSGRSLLPAVGLLSVVSFQPLHSHLAYPGFNEQCAQRDTDDNWHHKQDDQ